MGIKRLFSYFKPLIVEANIAEFKGMHLGIDGMAWLYQAFFGFHEYDETNPIALIRIIERKIYLLESAGIKVNSAVYVHNRRQGAADQANDPGKESLQEKDVRGEGPTE